MVGEPWVGFRRGEVWQAHVAFSGAVSHRCVTAGGRTYLGGGERLAAGEVVLAPEEAYHSPWVLWAWGSGWMRRRPGCTRAAPGRGADQTAPVIFDATAPAFAEHDPQAMLSLAEYAAAVGAEVVPARRRVVRARRAGPVRRPRGPGDAETPDDLAGLLARIREFDLEVGLAIEPERLDPESPIARDHPDWLLEFARDGVTRAGAGSVGPSGDGLRRGSG